jgi:hypothetical protein
MTFNQIAGILPAIVFPAATAMQFVRMLRAHSAAGVSATTWGLFGVANVALYIYADRYGEWQSILGLLGTAALDFAIAGMALVSAKRKAAVA